MANPMHPFSTRIKEGKSCCKKMSYILLTAFLALLLTTTSGLTEPRWPHITPSKDGTPISYEVYGEGEPALVFVHGWSCDARYWQAQLPYFSKSHRVVVLDLAGHGHSGSTRSTYSMKAFGEDVQAVTEATGSHRVILIGHSMGGPVIAQAARLMPDRVIGLIGVDTLANIEYPLTPEGAEKMVTPLENNFQGQVRSFVGEMMRPDRAPKLQEWILDDMAAAPPAVAISAMRDMMSQYVTGESSKIFDNIKAPVVVVNADLWPIDHDANRRHMKSFDAIVLKKSDHFLMMNRSKEFNDALKKAIDIILKKQK